MFTGSWEWLIIFGVLLLLFGGSKLPKLGGALGEGIRNFKKGIGGHNDDQIESSHIKDHNDKNHLKVHSLKETDYAKKSSKNNN